MGQCGGRARGEGDRSSLSQGSTTVLDLSGAEQYCSEPSPLEQVRRAFAGLGPGDRLEVRTPIADHAFSVRAWSRKQGIEVLRDERIGGEFVIVLRRPS